MTKLIFHKKNNNNNESIHCQIICFLSSFFLYIYIKIKLQNSHSNTRVCFLFIQMNRTTSVSTFDESRLLSTSFQQFEPKTSLENMSFNFANRTSGIHINRIENNSLLLLFFFRYLDTNTLRE